MIVTQGRNRWLYFWNGRCCKSPPIPRWWWVWGHVPCSWCRQWSGQCATAVFFGELHWFPTLAQILSFWFQSNKLVLATMTEIVNFITIFHLRSRMNATDPGVETAKKLCDKMDKGGREGSLFCRKCHCIVPILFGLQPCCSSCWMFVTKSSTLLWWCVSKLSLWTTCRYFSRGHNLHY